MKNLASLPKAKAAFIEPMDCAPVTKLPNGPEWIYEIKLDGYRAIAVKADGRVNVFSRRHKSFDHHYPLIVEALADLPEGTVVDGEIVALDDSGRPDFNLLQSFRSEASHIHYFIFDLLICEDRDLTGPPLRERRSLMESDLKLHSNRIRIAEQFEASASDMLAAIRQQKLEGVIGKRKDSFYEPGKRTGSWVKRRVNRGQELVIGGYLPGPHGFDSLIVGYYKGKDLMYVTRVRNGFVPASRRQVFEKIRHLLRGPKKGKSEQASWYQHIFWWDVSRLAMVTGLFDRPAIAGVARPSLNWRGHLNTSYFRRGWLLDTVSSFVSGQGPSSGAHLS